MRSDLRLRVDLLRVCLEQLADWDGIALGLQHAVSVAKSDSKLLPEQLVAWPDLLNSED